MRVYLLCACVCACVCVHVCVCVRVYVWCTLFLEYDENKQQLDPVVGSLVSELVCRPSGRLPQRQLQQQQQQQEETRGMIYVNLHIYTYTAVGQNNWKTC